MLWIQDPRGATDPCPSRGAADVASGSSGSSSSPEAVWAMAYVCYPLQRAQSSFCFKQRYVVLILPSFYLLLQPAESLSSSTSKFAICAGACHYDSLPPPVTPGPLFGRFMHPRSLTSQPWTRWRTRCFSEPLRWCFSGPKRDPNGTKHTHTPLVSSSWIRLRCPAVPCCQPTALMLVRTKSRSCLQASSPQVLQVQGFRPCWARRVASGDAFGTQRMAYKGQCQGRQTPTHRAGPQNPGRTVSDPFLETELMTSKSS